MNYEMLLVGRGQRPLCAFFRSCMNFPLSVLRCRVVLGSASSTSPHGVPAGGTRAAAALPQEQQQTASGAYEGGTSGSNASSRDAILKVIRRNLDSRRMPPQSTKDGESHLEWKYYYGQVFLLLP